MSKTTKAISTLSVLLLISRVFGFVREIIIAAHYGATYQTDAYNMATLIIALTSSVISTGVATVIVPMYNHKRLQNTKQETDSFVNNVLWATSLLCAVLAVAGIIFAPIVVRIFAPNFEPHTIALTANILRIMFGFIVAMNISSITASIAQIHDKFAAIIVAKLPSTLLVAILVGFFAHKIGVYALVISYVLFLLIQMLILTLSVRKMLKFAFVLDFVKNNDLKDVARLSFPLYMSVALWEINMLIDKILASGLPEGSVSAIIYASRLRNLPDGIITTSVITVMFPLLSRYAAGKEFAKLKTMLNKAISLLCMALLPVITISVYYAEEITAIVYERGAFTQDKTVLTANIFTFAVISLIFSGGASLLSHSFYSVQDTKTPQVAAVTMVMFNIAFNLILIRHMQAAGLALATSIASLVHFVVLFIQFRLKFGSFGGLALLKNVSKYAVATTVMLLMFFICEIFRSRLSLAAFFAVVALLSLLVYAVLLYLLKAVLFMEAFNRAKSLVIKCLKRG